ncbi:hypothetical protein GC176_22190 [bacterium]|nr:hypothetical protein [bacterium]
MAARVDKDWLKQKLAKVGVDGAVFFAVVARFWQLLSGPVTLVLLSRYFSPEERGYFYTFASVLALQTFFELSLHVVLINVASHEWAGLRLEADGSINGDTSNLSRLASLLRAAARWYGVASVLFVVGVGTGGAYFLNDRALPPADWLPQWIGLTLLTSLLLAVLPLTSLLEGCDQLTIVNRYRLRQAVTGSVFVWTLIVLRAGLWVSVVAAGVRLFWDLYLVAVRYRGFFRSLWAAPREQTFDWWGQVWPLQWRLAVGGIFGWLSMYLITPLIFHYHGSVAAGRMGMTWTVLTSLQAAAFAWVETRRPRFGQMIARREFIALDHLFYRVSAMSVGLLTAGSLTFCGVVALLPSIEIRLVQLLADALLPAQPTLLLALAVSLLQIARCANIYVRAHQREPFLVPGIISSLLIGGLVFVFGRQYGVTGAAAGYLAVITVFQVPVWLWIWQRFRAERDARS